jgi:uncharacterized short protein YbdD (DUF466 family)
VQSREVAMPDLQAMFDRSAAAARRALRVSTQTARLMVGVPDYETYVSHRRTNHSGQPIMSYAEFFRERQQARYAVGNGRFRGCC